MRDFKFRIWHKVKKHWTQYGINLLGETVLMGYVGYDSKEDRTIPLIELNDLVVTQYTGLKDLQGNDIYEGDIVQCLNHNPSKFLVEFIEGGFCCTYDGNYVPADINHFYPSVGCQIKVIGNRFENPELMV